MTDKFSIAAIAISILIVSIILYSFISSRYGSEYNRAIQSQNPLDKCATPAGYTDAEWKQHMGHHPDQYKECLK